MTLRALVSPDNTIVRTASNIDPNAGTKPGYRWIEVTPTPGPAVTHLQAATWEWVYQNDNVVQQWSIVDRPREPFVQAIKEEAQRRIMALVGAADIDACVIKQLNALKREGTLTLKRPAGGSWTAEEAAEAAALQLLADRIDAIRAKSNEIEAMDPIPADYLSDARWS